VIEPELYVCSSCGKEKEYLSESWHVVRFGDPTTIPALYFCLECISDKQEWSRAE
jgi:hypothetical protein